MLKFSLSAPARSASRRATRWVLLAAPSASSPKQRVRHGVPVPIVHKAAERTDKSKALVLWSRSLELFDDAGYVEPFLPAGFEVRGAQVSNGKDIIARVTFDS